MANAFSRENKTFRLPFYVVKRMGMPNWLYWCIRVGGIIIAFLAAGIACNFLKPGSFGTFYEQMVLGCFDPEDFATFIDLLISFSVLLIISLALTPAFKMKFWNIGAEGQVLIGSLVAAGISKFMPSSTPDPVIWLVAGGAAIVAGIIWSVLPAIFKAFFNTNETLFTLMMNYIAAVLTAMFISIWIKSGTQVFGTLKQGVLPEILENHGFIAIPVALLVFAFFFFYIKYSKQGYEITVVGESLNTARYVGINVKKVIIRTLIITGAVCGLLGFLLSNGISRTVNDALVGGRGFTGVLIAWLGHFEPVEIALFSFLSAIFQEGTNTAATKLGLLSREFSGICTSIFFFSIIACEFFSSYQIKFRHKEKTTEKEAK